MLGFGGTTRDSDHDHGPRTENRNTRMGSQALAKGTGSKLEGAIVILHPGSWSCEPVDQPYLSHPTPRLPVRNRRARPLPSALSGQKTSRPGAVIDSGERERR